MAWHGRGMILYGMVGTGIWYGIGWHGRGMTCHDRGMYGMAWHGMGMARYGRGMVWLDMVGL